MSGAAFRALFSDIISEAPSHVPTDDAGGDEMDASRVAVVIEDDPDIRNLIAEILDQAGFAVHTASTGAEGVAQVAAHAPSVTTLDVSMPGMDGFETAKRIRAISSTYVVMITARDDEIDTLQGLQSGADDYLTKPFRPRELRARIEAMMRRPRVAQAATLEPSRQADAGDEITHRGLIVDPRSRAVTHGERVIELTRSEFDILEALFAARGAVVSKPELATAVRGDTAYGSVFVSEHDLRAVEVHMANLRRKLGDAPATPQWIETVRGVGYRRTA